MARVTSLVGHSRSSIRVLTEASISPQAPVDVPKATRCRVLPSLPTRWPTRSSCCAMRWLAATISLNVSAILPSMPSRSPGEPYREVADPHRLHCAEQFVELTAVAGAVGSVLVERAGRAGWFNGRGDGGHRTVLGPCAAHGSIFVQEQIWGGQWAKIGNVRCTRGALAETFRPAEQLR